MIMSQSSALPSHFLTAIFLALLCCANAVKVFRASDQVTEPPIPPSSSVTISAASAAAASVEKKRWIVTLKDGITYYPELCEQLPCVHKISNVFSGVVIEASEPELSDYISSHGESIHFIEENRPVFRSDIASPQEIIDEWGLDRIDQRSSLLDGLYNWVSNGSGVTVYVVDTYVNVQHEDFKTEPGSATSRIRLENPAGIRESLASCVTEERAHGTHVSGLVGGLRYGVAKGVSLVAVQGLQCDGSSGVDTLLAALDYVAAVAQPPSVVSMSLGAMDRILSLGRSFEYLYSKGLFVVAAAGNYGKYDACDTTPSFSPAVFSVGSTGHLNAVSYFSNVGQCVALFAPGEAQVSADADNVAGGRTMSGTSMSTPLVSGAAALFLSDNPSAPPPLVAHALRAVGTPSVTGHTVQAALPGAGTEFGEWTNKLLYTTSLSSSLLSLHPLNQTLTPEAIITPRDAAQTLTFYAALKADPGPGQAVSVSLALSDAARGTVSPTTLTFDSSNYNIPQPVILVLSDTLSPASIGTDFFLDARGVGGGDWGDSFASALIMDPRTYLSYPGSSLPTALELGGLPATFAGDTNFGRITAAPACNFSTATAPAFWYQYTPSSDVTINITMCDSYFDATLVLMWQREDGAYAGLCNDDFGTLAVRIRDAYRCPLNPASPRLMFSLTANKTYYIMVSGLDGGRGKFVMQIKVSSDEKQYLSDTAPLLPAGAQDRGGTPAPPPPPTQGGSKAAARASSSPPTSTIAALCAAFGVVGVGTVAGGILVGRCMYRRKRPVADIATQVSGRSVAAAVQRTASVAPDPTGTRTHSRGLPSPSRALQPGPGHSFRPGGGFRTENSGLVLSQGSIGVGMGVGGSGGSATKYAVQGGLPSQGRGLEKTSSIPSPLSPPDYGASSWICMQCLASNSLGSRACQTCGTGRLRTNSLAAPLADQPHRAPPSQSAAAGAAAAPLVSGPSADLMGSPGRHGLYIAGGLLGAHGQGGGSGASSGGSGTSIGAPPVPPPPSSGQQHRGKYGTVGTAGAGPGVAHQAPTIQIVSLEESMTSKTGGIWTCKQCVARNHVSRTACDACGYNRFAYLALAVGEPSGPAASPRKPA